MGPEFQSLSSIEQQILWRKNCRQSSIAVLIRINVMKTGKDQLKNILGIIDSKDKTWENQFSGIVDLDSLKAGYVQDPAINVGQLDSVSKQFVVKLFQDVSELCSNDETFKLLILLSLLDPEDLPPGRNAIKLFSISDSTFRERLRQKV